MKINLQRHKGGNSTNPWCHLQQVQHSKKFNKNFSERYGISFFNHDKVSGKLKKVGGLQSLGIYSNPDRGTTSIKTADIDKDGDKDILVAVEGSDLVNAVQIFLNDGKGIFLPGQIISFKFDDFQFREFEENSSK